MGCCNITHIISTLHVLTAKGAAGRWKDSWKGALKPSALDQTNPRRQEHNTLSAATQTLGFYQTCGQEFKLTEKCDGTGLYAHCTGTLSLDDMNGISTYKSRFAPLLSLIVYTALPHVRYIWPCLIGGPRYQYTDAGSWVKWIKSESPAGSVGVRDTFTSPFSLKD